MHIFQLCLEQKFSTPARYGSVKAMQQRYRLLAKHIREKHSDRSHNKRLLQNFVFIFAISLCVITKNVWAQSAFEDNWMYYDIGGSRAVQESVSSNTQIGLDASVYAGAKYSCGMLDTEENIRDLLDNFKDGVDDLMDAMVFSAQAAIASLPAYILQRANPGLYELFQNALWRYEEKVRVAFRNCKEAERLIAQGKNPYKDWVVLAESTEWERQAQNGATATDADASIYENSRLNGIPWRNGEDCGGEGQSDCRVVADSIIAGYEFLQPEDDSALKTYFDSADAAAEWGVTILGDVMIKLSGEGQPSQQPGLGLTHAVMLTEEEVFTALTDMVSSRDQRTTDNFELVSAPGVVMTNSLVDAITSLPVSERNTATRRLASEVAAARNIDKALMLRRLLRSGAREANIAATPANKHLLTTVLPELDEEIDALLFEDTVRKQFVSATAKGLLRQSKQRNATQYRLPGAKPALISTDNGGGFIQTQN